MKPLEKPFHKVATDADLGRPDRRLSIAQPDCDICAECGEHAEFGDEGSECCGAGSYDTDPDLDMER